MLLHGLSFETFDLIGNFLSFRKPKESAMLKRTRKNTRIRILEENTNSLSKYRAYD